MVDDKVLKERVRTIIENRHWTTSEKVDRVIKAVEERSVERLHALRAHYL